MNFMLARTLTLILSRPTGEGRGEGNLLIYLIVWN